MYAMDHTMHTEHRPDERRHRWDPRRSRLHLTTTDPTPAAESTQPDTDSSPTHEFLD